MKYRARMKAKKQKAVKELFSKEENEKFLFIALSKLKIQKLDTHHLLDTDQSWYKNY